MKLADLGINLSDRLISLSLFIFNRLVKVGVQQIFKPVKDRRQPRTKKVLHEKPFGCMPEADYSVVRHFIGEPLPILQ